MSISQISQRGLEVSYETIRSAVQLSEKRKIGLLSTLSGLQKERSADEERLTKLRRLIEKTESVIEMRKRKIGTLQEELDHETLRCSTLSNDLTVLKGARPFSQELDNNSLPEDVPLANLLPKRARVEESDTQKILKTVFPTGTKVYWKGEEAVLKRFEEQVIIEKAGKEEAVELKELFYLPKEGDICLVQDVKNDKLKRYYFAEVLKVTDSQITIFWTDFKETEVIPIRALDQLLPIEKDCSLNLKMKSEVVTYDKIDGIGYYLAFEKSETSS